LRLVAVGIPFLNGGEDVKMLSAITLVNWDTPWEKSTLSDNPPPPQTPVRHDWRFRHMNHEYTWELAHLLFPKTIF